ncbi:hypothetical protein CEXT_216731 [Caerostris extrusa]|uniref:Uncharacterized protein n=1 Tax=Caerostris extrusa TaxID=172846 RepID=A0AAV4VSR8_CAEEX|nr:hypothetical protein CEXT_216731 [Caerostris extrusa]
MVGSAHSFAERDFKKSNPCASTEPCNLNKGHKTVSQDVRVFTTEKNTSVVTWLIDRTPLHEMIKEWKKGPCKALKEGTMTDEAAKMCALSHSYLVLLRYY